MKDKDKITMIEVNILFNDSRSAKLANQDLKSIQKILDNFQKKVNNKSNRFFIEIAEGALWSNGLTLIESSVDNVLDFCQNISSCLNIRVMVDIYKTSEKKGLMVKYKNGNQESEILY